MSKDLYEGIEFYEVLPDGLAGPLDNIRFAEPVNTKYTDLDGYAYVEVIDGKITRAFKEGEIVVKGRDTH